MPKMPTLFRHVFVALLLSASHLLSLAANNWEPVRKGQGREDVSTWVRSVDGMAVKAFRGVTEVHQSTLAVLALLSDIPNLSSWIYQCRSSEQPAGMPGEQTYARFRGIWPASDRDVLMVSSVSQQPDQSIVVDSRQMEGYPAQSGFVRMPFLHNTFRLVPLKGGWTRVEFDTQVDLGGLVPTWLANLVATNAPLTTLEGMRQQLQSKPKYQIKSIDALPAYYLKGSPLVMPPEHLAPEGSSQ
jgi:hypothetical protein